MGPLTSLLMKFFGRYPKVGGIFGLVVAALFAYLGYASWQEVQTMPEEPPRLTVAQAAQALAGGEDMWVTLTDVAWDCRNVVKSSRTEIIFSDSAGSTLGVATFSSGRESCDESKSREATGILRPMGDVFLERLPARGFDLSGYGAVASRVTLCTFCGRSNSTLGIILAVVFIPLGLAMYPLSLKLRKQFYGTGQNKPNHSEASMPR